VISASISAVSITDFVLNHFIYLFHSLQLLQEYSKVVVTTTVRLIQLLFDVESLWNRSYNHKIYCAQYILSSLLCGMLFSFYIC